MTTTITKKSRAEAVAEGAGATKLTALYMVDSLFETMRELLSDRQRIEIRGLLGRTHASGSAKLIRSTCCLTLSSELACGFSIQGAV